MYKYIVIGGGITGVSLGRLLQRAGEEDFLILEKAAEPGGLCRTKEIGGHVLDTGGGHFLQSRYPQVYDLVFAHLPRDAFNYFDRVSKVRVGEFEVDYPLESNFWQLPAAYQVRFLLAASRAGEESGKSEPRNFEEWIRWKLGDAMAEEYMIPYNRKIWGAPPDSMDLDWLSKIPRVDLETIIRNCLERRNGRDMMPSHEGFYYPKSGGFQRIFDALLAPLEHKVILNEGASKIVHTDSGWEINHKYRCEVLINTAPWPSLYSALGEPSVLSEHFERLVSNSVTVTLWEREHESSAHWIYEPSLDIAHHREFYIRNFAPHSKRSGVYTETNSARLNGEFPRAGITAGRPAIYEHTNEAAYPVPVIGHARAVKAILEYYRPRKLYGLGRWGQWRYMNSDVCIKEAMDFVANELHLPAP